MRENKKYGLVPSLFEEEAFFPNIWRFFPRLGDENVNTFMQHRSDISLSEDEKNVYIEAHLPGVKEKDIEITQNKGTVWIKGETAQEENDAKRKYWRKATSSFSYCVAVPENIQDPAKATASYENGVLTITYPKRETEEPKKIQITQKK